LNAKIKTGTLPALPLNENPLADWSTHLFTANRTQYILVTNTVSLYSTVLFGRGITGQSQFIDAVLAALRVFMQSDGHELAFQRSIAPAAGKVQFAKALDRSVTGSMNDLVKFAQLHLEDGLSLIEASFELSDIPFSGAGHQPSRRLGFPREEFEKLIVKSES
jgi:hypothetical protein